MRLCAFTRGLLAEIQTCDVAQEESWLVAAKVGGRLGLANQSAEQAVPGLFDATLVSFVEQGFWGAEIRVQWRGEVCGFW